MTQYRDKLILKRSLILRSIARFLLGQSCANKVKSNANQAAECCATQLLLLLPVKPIWCPFIGAHWKILVIYRCEPNYWRHERFSYDIKCCSSRVTVSYRPCHRSDNEAGWCRLYLVGLPVLDRDAGSFKAYSPS